MPRPRRFGGAREAFLYIVFFALLGVFTVQFGALAFAFVDAQFADPLDNMVPEYAANRLRWSIASLIVGYPIFLALGWRLNGERRRNPERRVSRVRAWLTYVTLIFAALVLIGDLVAVVYNFLSGDLRARFLAKAIIVGVISAGVLLNLTREAERQSDGVDWVSRLIALAATLATMALVIWAFFLVDTPGAARDQAFDNQRLQHLDVLARRVDCYRTYFDETPDDLAIMEEALRTRTQNAPAAGGCAGETPRDPATDAAYGYERLDGDGFRLCATFARGWPDEDIGPRPKASTYAGNRRALTPPAAPGETCFEFTAIDFDSDNEGPAAPLREKPRDP